MSCRLACALAPVVRAIFAFALVALCSTSLRGRAGAEPASALPASAHRYALSATVDDVHHRVHGHVHIAFTNTGAVPLESLLFHLYLNAFRDERSVFMRESGGRLRSERARGGGGIVLNELTVAGEDLLARAERELIPGDFSQLRVPLSRPLAPGEQVDIESSFVVTLPPLFARSGYVRDFMAVGQWFPKLAKLEPDGRFVGFPYHGLGEFYADFADYTLEVETPLGMTAVASGDLIEEVPRGAHRVRRFSARHVHDVAFVAARGYHEDVARVGDVLVRSFAPPGYASAVAEHRRVMEEGLAHFGRAFGAYPYGTLTLVVPPPNGDGAAGMEYPTLIVTESPWWRAARLPSLSGPFVTAHELAHQWFYGLFASNEVAHPALDEGLAQWASLDLVRAMYGAREGFGAALALERFDVTRIGALRVLRNTAPGLPAYAYTREEYGASVYARAALALESIRRAHGRVRFDRALAIYGQRQRFAHPTPADLEAAFDEAYGSKFGARVLRPLLFDGETSSVHFISARSRQRGTGFVTRLRARRTGAVSLPTWVALYDAAGRELKRARFPSELSVLDVALATDEKVARAVLDPDRALLLDARTTDQTARFASAEDSSLVPQVIAVAQALIGWLGP